MSNSSKPKSSTSINKIRDLLGEQSGYLLDHRSKTLKKDQLHLPGPDFIDRIWLGSDRPAPVLRSLQSLFDHGRLRASRAAAFGRHRFAAD